MACRIINNKIFIKSGDSTKILLDFNIDIAGASVSFSVKPNIELAEYIIQKIITNHNDASNGLTQINLSSEDTNIEVGEYVFDIQINLPGGETHTVFPSDPLQTGKFIVTKGVS